MDKEQTLADLFGWTSSHQEEIVLALYMWDRLTPSQRDGVARQFEEYQQLTAQMVERL